MKLIENFIQPAIKDNDNDNDIIDEIKDKHWYNIYSDYVNFDKAMKKINMFTLHYSLIISEIVKHECLATLILNYLRPSLVQLRQQRLDFWVKSQFLQDLNSLQL